MNHFSKQRFHLLWLQRPRHLSPLHGFSVGLVERHLGRVDGDGQHGVVGPQQFAVALQRRVAHVAVGQAVEQGVVGNKDQGAINHLHVVGRLQEELLGSAADQHRVHAEDHDWIET